MALIEVKKKFIFTDEGRNLLISQDGGVRFATIGGILVQGLTPVAADELWDTYRGLTFEQLLDNDNIVIGMPDVSYRSVNTGLIEPVNEEQYQAAIEDIKSGNGLKHMFGTYYKPNRELHSQSGSRYGTYEFTYDKTSLAWDMANDVSFSMLILLGKQYAETDDATFNVDTTQRPVIVGVAQLPGVYDDEIGPTSFEGGIEFLADQNKYICTSLRLQFTLTDGDHDATELIIDDQDYVDMMDKMSIINDGLKTKDEVHIVDANQPDETLEMLDNALSQNTDVALRVAPSPGSVATQRTMMIADPYYATDLENQWNAAAQVHIVNKKVDKDNDTMYKEQIVLTTLESPENLTAEELTAYYAGIMLRGTGNLIEGNSNKGAGPEYTPESGTSGISAKSVDIHYIGKESPIFRQVAVPEYDRYAVDIFGIENKILDENNIDKFIFSQRNVSIKPVDPEEYGYEDDTVNYGYNVTIDSHENFMNGNTNNTLIRSNGNILSGYSNCNLLFGSDKNLFENGANTNIVFGSDLNIFKGKGTQGNIIIGGSENFVDNTFRSVYFNGTGLKSYGKDEKILMGQFNADSDAKFVFGCGTNDRKRRNALEFFPETGTLKLYKNGSNIVTLGGTTGLFLGNNLAITNEKLVTEELKIFNDITKQDADQSQVLFNVNKTDDGSLIPQLWMKTVSGPNTEIGYDFNHILNYYNGKLNLAYNYHISTQGGPAATKSEANFFGGCADFMVHNGYGYVLINQSKDDATNKPSKNPDYTPSVEVYDKFSSIQITPYVINFTTKDPVAHKSLGLSDIARWNKLIETEYRKLSIDVITDYNTDTSPVIGGWRCGIRDVRGPKFYRNWIRNLFDTVPPLFMNGHTYNSSMYSNIYNSDGALGKELLYLGKDHSSNNTTFNARAKTVGGQLFWKKNLQISYADDAEPLYSIEIPYDPEYNGSEEGSGMLDEIEINIQLSDISDTAWIFPAIFWMKDNGYIYNMDKKIPRITLNVSLYDCGNGNGKGEDFYIWKYNHFKNQNRTGDKAYKEYLYNHSFGSNEYEKIHRFTSYPVISQTAPIGAGTINNYTPCGWLADDFDDADS